MDDGGLEEREIDWSKDYTLRVGMEFDTETAAYDFYNDHGRVMGFSVRKCYFTRSKKDGILINRKFVCNKQGKKGIDKRSLVVEQPRKETRTKCDAFMYITFNRDKSKWSVKNFEEKHNHLLHIPETVYRMRSQRKIHEAQALNIAIAVDSGLSLKASHDLISAQVGGKRNVGFTQEDHKSFLRSRRQRSLQYGEAGALLGYFQTKAAENPYFFYRTQLDVDEQVTNIFWADHEMITNYGLFGDSVSFDTTFRTNKDCRPLALFTGFNHFKMTTIFGAALLYDETIGSFEWLFENFLFAMEGKKPVSLFTDQDAAMANAISIVMPGVTHGLCSFHLQQNALKHLGHLYKNDSDFGKDFSACMFEYIDEEDLFEGWDTLVKKYDLSENMWIKKTWGLREKWAHAYLKLSFTAGMRSTQLSESLNAKVKKYVKFDHDIVQFFTHFDRLVMEKRDEESDSIYHSREKLPRQKLKKSPILIQVAQLYTPPIFDLFHDEVDTSLACIVKQHSELEGEFKCVIGLHNREKKMFLVSGNVELDEFGNNVCVDVRCACRKFENFGILCGHAIKGLDRMGVLEIPERYILGRWRLDAKGCASKGSNVSVEEEDPKLVKAARYRNLCSKMVKLGARACQLKVAYDFVNTTVDSMCGKVDKMFLEEGDSIEEGNKEVDVIHSNLVQAKGLKRKTTPRRGGARLKPWHEKIGKRRRVASKATHLGQVLNLISSLYNPIFRFCKLCLTCPFWVGCSDSIHTRND